VVESGLSWDDSEPYKKVDLNSQTEEEQKRRKKAENHAGDLVRYN